jgi:hypothetical protein
MGIIEPRPVVLEGLTVQITFLLLAHQQPQIVKRLLGILTAAGHSVALHYDLKAPAADYAHLTRAFGDHPQVRFAKRARVEWAQWSIVAATLNGIEAIEQAGWRPDYVYYGSGTDYPIRAATELEGFLLRNRGTEFIEGVPANVVPWVRGGPQQERYQYRFYFNWRGHHQLSQRLLRWQRALRLKRKFVLGLEPYIGSQWWVLTWETLQRVMPFARRPEVVKFFRTTLIPDELFFQTVVYNLLPGSKIVGRPLTLSQFTDYMTPVIFYSDHLEYLLRQPFFMARKLSPYRAELYDALDAVWRGERPAARFDDDQFGVVSPEYEKTRLSHRQGSPGQPIIGRPSNSWSGGLERLQQPYFAVLGTSAAELRFAHTLLSRHPALLCHRQLFHPDRVELAPRTKSFAGYGDVALRNQSAPDFLADLIRAEPGRQTGFLLRSGHGWHIPEVLFDRPSARVMVIHGDPLIGFLESLGAVEPLLANALDEPALLRSLLPSILVKRFVEYEKEFAVMKDRLTKMVANSKPKGVPPSWSWLSELDLDLAQPSRMASSGPCSLAPSATGWVEQTLARWRDWLTQAETCLDVMLVQLADRRTWSRLTGDLDILQKRRQALVALLIAGGRTGPIPRRLALGGSLPPPAEPAASARKMVGDLTSASAEIAPDGSEAAGRSVPGSGAEPPNQAEQPESAFISEMNREPPNVSDR